jgi:hypothetical protein
MGIIYSPKSIAAGPFKKDELSNYVIVLQKKGYCHENQKVKGKRCHEGKTIVGKPMPSDKCSG